MSQILIAGNLLDRTSFIGWLFQHRDLLTNLLSYFDRWRSTEDGWDTTDGLRARVKLAGEVLAQGALLSESTVDDDLVAWCTELLNNDALLSVTASLIRKHFMSQSGELITVSALAQDEHEAFAAEYTAQGVDFAKWLARLPELIAMLNALRGLLGK